MTSGSNLKGLRGLIESFVIVYFHRGWQYKYPGFASVPEILSNLDVPVWWLGFRAYRAHRVLGFGLRAFGVDLFSQACAF